MRVTPEIYAYVNWLKNINKKVIVSKDIDKRENFTMRFKASLRQMTHMLSRLEQLNPPSMMDVLEAGIDAMNSEYMKASALKRTEQYVELYGGFRPRTTRDGKPYDFLSCIRDYGPNKYDPKTKWRKMKVFEINYRDSNNLQVIYEYKDQMCKDYVPKKGVPMGIKKMFLNAEEMAKLKTPLSVTQEQVDLIIYKMALWYNERNKQLLLRYKRQFQNDAAALKLYAIAEALVLHNDIEAAKLILSAKIIDQLPLTPNARNYFTLRSKNKVCEAWAGLKNDYPTLKSLQDIDHPENLVPNYSDEGLRKYFMQMKVEKKFDPKLYKYITEGGEYNTKRIENIDNITEENFYY